MTRWRALLRLSDTSLRIATVLVAIATSAPAVAAPPESLHDDEALFSLQRVRREQALDGVAAAPFRSDLPWSVGAAAGARPHWLRLSAGAEWDKRPTLFSISLGPPDEISFDSEAGGVWLLDAGYELYRGERFVAGIAGTYWGSAHANLDYDTHYPSITPYVDWNIDENDLIRLRYDLGHAWVDNDGLATTHSVGPRWYHEWEAAGVTEVRFEYYDYDFDDTDPDFPVEEEPLDDGFCVTPPTTATAPCGPFNLAGGDRRDRSGWGFISGGDHRVRFAENDTEVRGGYRYQHYLPDGAEFHNQSHALWIEATTALPFGAVFNANLSFLYRGMRNLSAYPRPGSILPNQVWDQIGIRRKDTIWRTHAAIARPIGRFANVSLEYGFVDQDSNHDRYDFRGHRIGGYVTVHLE